MFQLECRKIAETSAYGMVKEFEWFLIHEETGVTEKFFPRTDVAIAFHFKSLPIIRNENPVVVLKPFYVAPINKKFLDIELRGEVDSFVVLCKPTVLSRVFMINLSDIHQHMAALQNYIFQPLWEKLSLLNTLESRVDCFFDFLTNCQETTYIPDPIDKLYDKILEESVTTPLRDIVMQISACERTMERNFLTRAGVSMKTLSRIVRFNYLWDKVTNKNTVDFMDMVFYGKYFDQTHFIKDFKSITGEVPHYFFNRNLQLAKSLSGRE